AWLVANGFEYLTDELVALTDDRRITAFPRPLLLKAGSAAALASLALDGRMRLISTSARPILVPAAVASSQTRRECRFVVFPPYSGALDLGGTPLAAAEAGLRLMECNLNARNLRDPGFAAVAAFARDIPAIALRYGDVSQLDGVCDLL